MPAGATADDRKRVLELASRHGSGATALQTVRPGFCYFWHGREACVAYVDTGRAWVAAGAPIAAAHERAAVVSAFLSAAREAGKRACFFASEELLSDAAGQPLRSLAIGEQPIWDPRAWLGSLRKHRSLREQLRRARAKGIVTRELDARAPGAARDREQVAVVSERWLASRHLAPMGFLVQLVPLGTVAPQHTIVALQNERVVGFASLLPVPARGGWFLEHLVRDPAAPNGTSELLVHAAMTWAAESECSWLTLGLAPLSGKLSPVLVLARSATRWLYDFAGLRAYKAKLRPDSWQTAYLCYPHTEHAAHAVLDALSAFAIGGFLRFGWSTLLRGRALQTLRSASLQLTPWTLLGPIWAAVAAAGYASRASLAAATSTFTSTLTSRSKSGPRAIGS